MEDLNLLSDETLVSLFAKGENSAFDELLQRHQNRIFSYILNIVKDKELADDLFQETFVKAIVTIKQGRYTENGKFLAWIMHCPQPHHRLLPPGKTDGAGVVRQRGHRHPQPQGAKRRNN